MTRYPHTPMEIMPEAPGSLDEAAYDPARSVRSSVPRIETVLIHESND
jgi:hypothetical protein